MSLNALKLFKFVEKIIFLSVSNKHVLVSARCIRKTSPGSSHLLFENGSVKIKEIFIHPDSAESNFEADIAIALLEKAAEVSENIRHICLNNQPIGNFVGRDAIGVGWELPENNKISTQKEEVSTSIADQSVCPGLNTESLFCAAVKDESSVFNGKI